MRAIDIVTSDNDYWELETLLVRVDQHLGSGFAGSVWVGWCQNASFQQIIGIVSDFTVHLVGGDMDKLLDSNLLRALQKNVGSVYVGVCKGIGVSETQVDVGLRREVEDGINVVPLQTVHNLGRVRDVSMVECEIALVLESSGVVQ